MDLNLFRQDIKKICLLTAFQQSLSSDQKNADFDFLHISNDFCSTSFLPKVSEGKERGWKLNFGLWKW